MKQNTQKPGLINLIILFICILLYLRLGTIYNEGFQEIYKHKDIRHWFKS